MTEREGQGNCDLCGQPIHGNTVDLWAFVSVWDEENGWYDKTGEGLEGVEHDYVVVGESCCGPRVRTLWNQFVGHTFPYVQDK